MTGNETKQAVIKLIQDRIDKHVENIEIAKRNSTNPVTLANFRAEVNTCIGELKVILNEVTAFVK